ncbi:hypothetical protein GCM10027290_03270 [Micromonospora sonneratiae]|uniref:CHAT domain-containing protein n=1 Tax=Micromonospora sonneratiae TaxID=1184706 RepID=A0ABW3Y8U3_9ACTN
MAELFVTFDGSERLTLSIGSRDASAEFRDPFTETRVEELRWLLEDCPPLPFGPQRQRYQAALADAAELGHELYRALTTTAETMDLFGSFAGAADENRSVHLISEEPEPLAIPWELLRVPGTDVYPLASARELTRCLGPADRHRADEETVPVWDGPLRVLLVSPRPYGAQDVRSRTIRGPMLTVAAQAPETLRLDLLHPPTMDRLREVLTTQGDYSIVHFDGHGFFRPGAVSAKLASGLVLERADGRPDLVAAADFAAAVAVDRIPVVVLNACRSAHRSTDPSVRTVASALLAGGIPEVLAMTHNVPAMVASRFMSAFYRSVGRRETPARAASAGRRAVLDLVRQPSTRLGLTRPFQVMPVLYRQDARSAPIVDAPSSADGPPPAHAPAPGPVATPVAVPAPKHESDDEFDDLDMVMYRDDEVTHLDRQLMSAVPVVVHAPVGGGKSTFLRSYARYVELTHLFDQVELVCARQDGTTAEQLLDAARLAARTYPGCRVLHVWDGMDDLVPSCAEALALLPAGHRVVIGLRHDTLSVEHHSYPLADIPPEVTGMFLRRAVFDRVGEQDLRTLSEPLLRWLIRCIGWHGATLQAVTRALGSVPVEQLCHRLEFGVADGPDDPLSDPAIEQCLEALPPTSLRALSLLGLHGRVVLPRLLTVLTDRGLEGDPFTRATGAVVTVDEWCDLLAEACGLGLARQITDDPDVGFEVPPLVRYALRGRLATWFSADAVAALSQGVSAAAATLTAGTSARRAAADRPANPYADRIGRDLTLNLLESAMWLSVWHALRTGAYGLARTVAEAFADEPVGSFGWTRARSLLGDIYHLAYAEHATRPGADAFFNRLDAILGHAAMVRTDWSTAKLHIDRLLQDDGTPFVRQQVVMLRLHLVTIMVELGAPAEAVGALRAAVADAMANGSAEELTACRVSLARLVDALALSRSQAEALAMEVGLPPVDQPTPARSWDAASTEELISQLRVADLRGDFESSVNLRRYLGARARRGGDLAGAREWLTSALNVEQSEGRLSRTSLAATAHELAMVEEESGNLDDAAHWCAYVIESAPQPSRLYADAHHELGIVELHRGRFPESTTAFETALGYYRSRSMPIYAAETAFLVAYVLKESGAVEEALRRCAELLDEFLAAESWSNVVRVNLFMAQTNAERGDPGRARAQVAAAREALPGVDPAERSAMSEVLDQIMTQVTPGPDLG